MSAREGRVSRARGAAEAEKRPLYARLLRLNHIQPGPWWCFLFLEGSLGLAGVLVLADWVSLWGLLVLPLGVAIAVKLNDVVAGAMPTAAPAHAADKPTIASSSLTGTNSDTGSNTGAKVDGDVDKEPDRDPNTDVSTNTGSTFSEDGAALIDAANTTDPASTTRAPTRRGSTPTRDEA